MKNLFYPLAAILCFSCSTDAVLEDSALQNREVPIAFNTFRQNVTKAGDLQDHGHYNFGVWAYKVSSNQNAQVVMDNYLVGFSDGATKGYDKTGGSTWAGQAGTVQDHKSQWFYENLGKSQYTYSGSAGFYTASQTDYMSGNDNQFLRYWDLAYTNTNFFCYTPYRATGVICNVANDGSATMTFAGTSLQDRYDNPVNSTYSGNRSDRSLTEFMYAGVQATNSAISDIVVPFKHMGAQLFIRFYEDVPGYKVELIDLSAGDGTMVSTATEDQKKGVQATPAVAPSATGEAYTKGSYFTTSGATISYSTSAVPTFVSSSVGATSTQENLMFMVPNSDASLYPTVNVPGGFAANLTDFQGQVESIVHKQICEKVASGSDQTYSWSPTIYYPVAQPSTQKTGFTFHISYRIIAEDNKEFITVHNATVFVPADVTTWATNTRYIYTFRITTHSSGSTSPSDVIDPTNPTPGDIDTIYPIVFDGCTIEDYIDQTSDVIYDVNQG